MYLALQLAPSGGAAATATGCAAGAANAAAAGCGCGRDLAPPVGYFFSNHFTTFVTFSSVEPPYPARHSICSSTRALG